MSDAITVHCVEVSHRGSKMAIQKIKSFGTFAFAELVLERLSPTHSYLLSRLPGNLFTEGRWLAGRGYKFFSRGHQTRP